MSEPGTKLENLVRAASAVLSHYNDDDYDGNGPGHGHVVPGVWDETNAAYMAGMACVWCAEWAYFRQALAQAKGDA